MNDTDWTEQRAQLQRYNAIERAAEDLRGRGILMGPDAIAAAAVLLAPLHGAPLELKELAEYVPVFLQPRWTAATGHRIYRAPTVQAYRDLRLLLCEAGYRSGGYPECVTFPMRDSRSVVLVKPQGEEVDR